MGDVPADKKTEYSNKMYVFPSTFASRLNLYSPLATNPLLFYQTHRASHWSYQIVNHTRDILKHSQTSGVNFTAAFVVLALETIGGDEEEIGIIG